MYESGVISQPIFSFFLTDYFADPWDSAGSKFLIGGYDLEKYAKAGSEVVWHDLTDKTHWAVNIKAASLRKGDKELLDFKTKSTRVIVDTGTSYTLMPVEDYQNLIKTLNEEYNFDLDSSSGVMLPST